MDGSAEPANEILEQTAHDRPLVAQTYSAAVAKGTVGSPLQIPEYAQTRDVLPFLTFTQDLFCIGTFGLKYVPVLFSGVSCVH